MIIVKKKNEKIYVYDNETKKGRYYNIVDGALDEYYKSLFLTNKDKIRKKSNKYVKDLVEFSEKGIEKKKQRQLDLNKLNSKDQNRFKYARDMLDKDKHGVVELNYKDDYIDDIGLNMKLLEQVVIDKRKVKKLMKHRNYIKDLIMIEVQFKGYNKSNKIQNSTLGNVKLFNCDFEYLKGILADHKFVGFELYYVERAKNMAIFQAIFGTDNVDLVNADGKIEYLKIKATIGCK